MVVVINLRTISFQAFGCLSFCFNSRHSTQHSFEGTVENVADAYYQLKLFLTPFSFLPLP